MGIFNNDAVFKRYLIAKSYIFALKKCIYINIMNSLKETEALFSLLRAVPQKCVTKVISISVTTITLKQNSFIG